MSWYQIRYDLFDIKSIFCLELMAYLQMSMLNVAIVFTYFTAEKDKFAYVADALIWSLGVTSCSIMGIIIIALIIQIYQIYSSSSRSSEGRKVTVSKYLDNKNYAATKKSNKLIKVEQIQDCTVDQI